MAEWNHQMIFFVSDANGLGRNMLKIGKCCGSCIAFDQTEYECFGECTRCFKLPLPQFPQKGPHYIFVDPHYVCDLWEGYLEKLELDDI